MKSGLRTIAATVAALVAGLAVSAYAAAGTGAPAPGPVAIGPATLTCVAAQLSATYTLDPFSQGVGHVSYTLTITNKTQTACELAAPESLRLLSKSGKPLPTHASTSPGGRYTLTLAGGQWAQADSRFSPDISGPGEGNPCEPTAHRLRIAIGSGHMVAPMDPTSVCGHGQIAFARLRAVAILPACAAAWLTAKLGRVSRHGTSADYGLALSNTGANTCYLDGAPGLRLLSTTGAALPTRVRTSVPDPIVVGHHHQVSLLANFASIFRPGSGEPSHGPCEPKAANVQISPHPGEGHLTAALAPPTTVCHRGTMTLSGLVPGDPFP